MEKLVKEPGKYDENMLKEIRDMVKRILEILESKEP